jgi:hypothetical protein
MNQVEATLIQRQRKFLVQFATIDGDFYSLSGRINRSLHLSGHSKAIVEYENISRLTGRSRFSGSLEGTTYEITMANGVLVKGNLDVTVGGKTEINGEAVWLSI